MIEGSVSKAANGVNVADKTADVLREIVDSVTKTTDLVSEIAAAANEQAQGIGQINVGLGQVDQVTQQNTANAEESAAASVELSSQAEQMRQMLARFTLKNQIQLQSQVRPQTVVKALPGGGAKVPQKQVPASPEQVKGKTKPETMIALDDNEFGKF